MLQSFSQIEQGVQIGAKKCVVVAAANDGHCIESVATLANAGLLDYLFVGDPEKIMSHSGGDFLVNKNNILPAFSDADCARLAVKAVKEGRGDFLMKGLLPTPTLLRAVLHKEEGLSTGRLLSHVGIFESPVYHKLLMVTDGGIAPQPSLGQKQEILENAIEFLRALGYTKPKIGILAASEEKNPKIVESADATALVALFQREGIIIDGPLSLDLAISAAAAQAKGITGPVCGDADLLLAPSLAAGNILGKAMVYLGACKMAGCVIGASVPIVLTSRGSTTEEKRLSLLLCCGAAEKRKVR